MTLSESKSDPLPYGFVSQSALSEKKALTRNSTLEYGLSVHRLKLNVRKIIEEWLPSRSQHIFDVDGYFDI